MLNRLIPLLFLLAGCTSSIRENTVAITNLAGTSGGSGSVVHSASTESFILTNAHVCGLAKNGALVHSSTGTSHAVVSYKVSDHHDLCLIKVNANLHASASVASTPPQVGEESTVSGHPKLLPLITTKGAFAGKRIIPVFSGLRACTDAEKEDPALGFLCQMIGGIPVIKIYESMVISSLIQPGSSGSAVYNKAGQISAVVFAGSGDIGFGFTVPQEYVSYFLLEEVRRLPALVPNNTISLVVTETPPSNIKKSLAEACEKAVSDVQKKTCSTLEEELKYSNLLEGA